MKGEETTAELAHRFEGAASIFGDDHEKRDDQGLIPRLYQQIGQLKVERDFLESRLGR